MTQLAVKLCRARIAHLEAAVAEVKTASADTAAAAAEKEIGALEDSLDGELGGQSRPCVEPGRGHTWADFCCFTRGARRCCLDTCLDMSSLEDSLLGQLGGRGDKTCL